MKRTKIMATFLILCMCMALFLTGCTEEEINTTTSSEGVVTFYQTSNRDNFMAYVKGIDTAEYDILDISSIHNTSFAVTIREKGKWKTSENVKAYDVAVLDGYYLFSTTNKKDYLDFLEQFEPEIYQILGITANPGNSYYAVTYVEIKTN